MAEKNTKDNKNSKKKHKWIGIFLIALLLLFIGAAGYYLERDLEPVPDNQIEESEVLDERADSLEEESAPNGEERETQESDERSDFKDETTSSDSSDIEDTDRESEQPAIEQSTGTEQGENEVVVESESKETAPSDMAAESGQPVPEHSSEKGDGSEQEDKSDNLLVEGEDAVKDEQIEATAGPEAEGDLLKDRENSVEDDSQLDSQEESERQTGSDVQDNFSQELEDPSLFDRILSILGLSDSSFSQDLNILFVGLDDEESVAVGTIEADSIMVAKLRPELNKIQLENIDEETNYKGQLLREYYNGDIKLAAEEITETEIDYYVYVNYQGFEKVIDELGGVKITLEQEIKVPGLGLNLKTGDNLLSGKEALNFVRWRSSDSIDRLERQKLLITSVVAKLKSNNLLFNVNELYNTIVEGYSSIETDINPVLSAEIFNYLRENDELELEFIE